MPSSRPSAQRGLIRGPLILLLLLVIAAGAGWWWFLGRFRVPEKAPERPEQVEAVLDYLGRTELGTDPLEQMEKPQLSDATQGGMEAKVHLKSWGEAYLKTAAARVAWKTAEAAGALVQGVSAESYHIDYLHHAQQAEYYRARYKNALETE